VAPAIETFGTHRIIFGSTEAAKYDSDVSVPITGAAWYALLRKTVSELGQDQEAMNHIMGQNAEELYGLK
jgi:predicted TIM-barrel fold metal-dependent hydrolase